MEITKERFEEVYNKHLPNKFIKFVFKYYAKDDETTSGIKISVTDKIAWFILLPLIVLGILFTALNLPKHIIALVVYPYGIILSTMVLVGFVGVQWNNFRIRKIAKELGVSLIEYNKLVDSFYD